MDQHNTTDLSINNKWHRRVLVLLLLKTTSRFYKHSGPCVPISHGLLVKYGPLVDLEEAATFKFIGTHTSIPVPDIYCAFVRKGKTYIAMQRIHAESMAKFMSYASEFERKKVFRQLKGMLDQMRILPAPSSPSAVQSCANGTVRECRIAHSTPRFGPFARIQEFHLYLRDGLQLQERPSHMDETDWEDIKEMVTRQDVEWPPTVFTHGDLNPFNILVRNGKIAAIIDWENAGWLPHYWEWTSAWTGNIIRQAWQVVLPQFLDPHPEELHMELIRQKWWGEF